MPGMRTYKLKSHVRPVLGCDPEAFFSKNGKIIGSEKVMPEGGVIYRHGVTTLNANPNGENRVIVDGVQFELNPLPSQCRESLSFNIQQCFSNLSKRLQLKQYKGIKADFSQLIEVDKDEFDSLSGACKVFGCMPSKNVYGEINVIKVDPKEYRIRCAGGHIHLGNVGDLVLDKLGEKELIQLLDVIVGNTCVLLDRDPGNVERRKVYGRAGEYRTPKWGIEYRTPSNFWLRSYPLMSFVMGLSRLAVNILHSGDKHYDAIMKKVKIDDIRKAINENDFELAYKNFSKIKTTLLGMITGSESVYSYPFSKRSMPMFEYLVKVGIDEFFDKEKTLQHWITRGNGCGWERFLELTVAEHMKKTKIKK